MDKLHVEANALIKEMKQVEAMDDYIGIDEKDLPPDEDLPSGF